MAPRYAAAQSLSTKPAPTILLAQDATSIPPPQRPRDLPHSWFDSHIPSSPSSIYSASSQNTSLSQRQPSGADPEHQPPGGDNDRKVKLGKTLRILQERLPTLLQSPLPQEVLSPNISLHLFPSTHPHLPVVTGRVAYIAALWSSPIAWNRVPLVGNVRLEILSERMVDQNHAHAPLPGGRRPRGAYGEQLIVRWRTVGKTARTNGNSSSSGNTPSPQQQARESAAAPGEGRSSSMGEGDGGSESVKGDDAERPAGGATAPPPPPPPTTNNGNGRPVGNAQPVGASNKEFTGLFIFDFDREGRILSHTIEHVQESGQWERGVGAKVVGLTDWLLGGIKGGGASEPCPAFAAVSTSNSSSAAAEAKDRRR